MPGPGVSSSFLLLITSKALVTRSDALVTSSFLLLVFQSFSVPITPHLPCEASAFGLVSRVRPTRSVQPRS